MRRPVGILRVPGVERPEPEAAEGRSKDRKYKLDRAILRPPVFQFYVLTAVPAARERLRMGGQKWPTAGRPFRGPPATSPARSLRAGQMARFARVL